MSYRRKSRTERKSQNRGRVVSFLIHAVLLLVFFLPFLSMKPPEEPSKEALVIQFDYPYNEYVKPEKFVEEEKIENMDMASKMSGSEAGGSAVDEEPMQSRPQEAAPSRLAAPSITSVSKPSSALRSNVSDIPLPTPKVVSQQSWASVNDFTSSESDGVEEMKMLDWSDGAFGDIPGSGPGDGEDDSDIWSDGFGSGTGGQGGSGGGTGSTTGAGSGPGGGTGTGNAGNKTGVGQNGSGLEWGVGVDGAFNRKMIRRADVGSLAVKEGKIAMVICVDRSGMVVQTKYDLASSTLKDPTFVKKAETVAKNYIFNQDSDAPELHCGKLTFIFKIK